MDPIELARHYYDAFRNKTSFEEVPLAEGLRFSGPSGRIDGAEPFRQVVAGLAQRAVGLELREQLAGSASVHSLYDFDLGLPDGPIPMAEVLRMQDGEICEIELFFDGRRLPGAVG